MTVAIPNMEASIVTVSGASKMTAGRIRHGVEMSRNL
jgi:hypothetical protein